MRLAVLLLTLLLAAPAVAQRVPTDSVRAPVFVASPAVAHFVSVVGTVGPIALSVMLIDSGFETPVDSETESYIYAALIAAGYVVGPGVGYVYGGDREGRLLRGVGVRIGAAALYVGGYIIVLNAILGSGSEDAAVAGSLIALGSMGLAAWSGCPIGSASVLRRAELTNAAPQPSRPRQSVRSARRHQASG